MINRLISLFAFLLISFAAFGQGHTVFSNEDPAFYFIQEYLPEYYYEENVAGGDKKSVEFSVRTLYNYEDEKTFSYFILVHDAEWGCIDIDEIDSIITYLERVSDKSSFPSKTATLVYNTRRGFKFESNLLFSNPTIKLSFPKNGPSYETKNPSTWIKALKKGKEYVKYDTQFVAMTDIPDENHESYAVRATARVRFRNVIGALPKPKSLGAENGKVVVQIEIDQYGNVISAIPGAEGTTLVDKDLWNEARSAAMKTHFNTSASSPTTQSGIIIYTF